MALSQNGWLANRSDLCKWYSTPGTNVELKLRKDRSGQLLVLFVRLFHARVEPIKDPGCWSYAVRPIRGATSGLSNHASGTAVDLNAPKHPLGRSGTFTAAQAAEIRRLVGLTGGAIRWGGSYSGRKDEMHFEINTTSHAVIDRAIVVLTQELQR